MFDLEQSISAWRSQMLAAGIQTPVPLDELESHLREDIADQIKSGLTEQEAFDAALRRFGQPRALKREFMKMSEPTQVLRQKLLWVFISLAFLGCWFQFGQSPALALAYAILLAGLIIASFIDFKYFIIPDEITIGGILAGALCSFLLPQLQGQKLLWAGLMQSLLGIGAGAGLLYFSLRIGKLAFGRQQLPLSGETKITFADTALLLPDRSIPYDELFYRKSDTVEVFARSVVIGNRSYQDVPIRLTSASLQIGDDRFSPDAMSQLEAVCTRVVLPRKAMGLGDVKLMAAIGAFLGWQAAIFSVVASSVIGSFIGLGLIVAHRRSWSSRLPYGPYIALGAAVWIFCGKQLIGVYFGH